MQLNDSRLEECQRALNACSARILAVSADIAQVSRGVRSWIRLREDLELLAASMEAAQRISSGTHTHVKDVLLKYEAHRKSLRTGVPINDLVKNLVRKMHLPPKNG